MVSLMRLPRVRVAIASSLALASLLMGFELVGPGGLAAASEGSLPDGRGYEMLTPVENHDANVYTPLGGKAGGPSVSGIFSARPSQAAPDGSAVVYVADPTVGGTGSSGNGSGNDYLATRSAGGWSQVNLQPPGLTSTVYVGFSNDLSKGVIQSGEGLTATAPRGYQDLFTSALESDEYLPFFTVTPPHRSTGEFRAATAGGFPRELGEFYAGASTDFTRQFFAANDALTANAVDGGKQVNNLYESVAGELRLVNVLPDGSTEADATFGSPPLSGSDPPGVTRAISDDGRRVFWTDLGTHALYLREDGTSTVQVDASQGSGPSGGGLFWTASSDGSKVFFTDCSRLTADATAVSGEGCGALDSDAIGGLMGNDLYEYEVSTHELHDLTVDSNASDALGANVQGVVGASEDGQFVYFVADGVLASGATAGQPNLYVHHAGVTRFIATLAFGAHQSYQGFQTYEDLGEFYGNGSFNDFQPSEGHRTAEVTPSGEGLVFMSDRSLTGYPSGSLYEVYDYDFQTAGLSCISCNPSGEAPEAPFVGEVAGFLPVSESSVRMPRVISGDGNRVFFDSYEPLVPQDTNDRVDVYEWERDGTGSCQGSAGCVYLLTGGTSVRNSYLLEASETGEDAFLITAAQLLAQDQNETYDLYDARVGALQPVSPPSCTGTGCQGLPESPPIFATPASLTFEGIGNFAPSTKKAAKRKGKRKRPKSRRKLRSRRHANARRRARHAKHARRPAKHAKHVRAEHTRAEHARAEHARAKRGLAGARSGRSMLVGIVKGEEIGGGR